MSDPVDVQPEEWYADGLRFSCTQCGNCCTGPSGYVWFDKAEGKVMAEHFGMTPKAFRKKYAHKYHGDWTLNEVKSEQGYDCVFLRRHEDGRGYCSIYEVRPTQCKTWPFWPDLLKSPRTWQQASRNCPGMAKGDGNAGEGKLYTLHQIRIQRDATP